MEAMQITGEKLTQEEIQSKLLDAIKNNDIKEFDELIATAVMKTVSNQVLNAAITAKNSIFLRKLVKKGCIGPSIQIGLFELKIAEAILLFSVFPQLAKRGLIECLQKNGIKFNAIALKIYLHQEFSKEEQNGLCGFVDEYGNKAIHYAAASGNVDVCQRLIKKEGVKVFFETNKKKTCSLNIACVKGHIDVVKLLFVEKDSREMIKAAKELYLESFFRRLLGRQRSNCRVFFE